MSWLPMMWPVTEERGAYLTSAPDQDTFCWLWLHSFEEPFLNAEQMEALGRRTDFVVKGTRFTGALCCLILRKAAVDETKTLLHIPCEYSR